MDTLTIILLIIHGSLPIGLVMFFMYKGLEHDYNKQVESNVSSKR